MKSEGIAALFFRQPTATGEVADLPAAPLPSVPSAPENFTPPTWQPTIPSAVHFPSDDNANNQQEND